MSYLFVGGQPWPWLRGCAVTGVAVLMIALHFMFLFTGGLLVNPWMKTFHLSAVQAGWLSGSYFAIYAAFQIPGGFLMDRYGARCLLSLAALVASVGCGLFAHATTFWLAVAGRLMMGGGLAFCFVGFVVLAARWFPPQRFALVIGLGEMMTIALTSLVELALPHWLASLGWRVWMERMGWVTLSLAVLAWWIVRDRPDQMSSSVVVPRDWRQVLRQTARLFKRLDIWCMGWMTGGFFSMLTVFSGLWLHPFFHHVYSLSTHACARLSSIILLGVAAASPVVGWLAEKRSARLPVLFVCAGLSVLPLLLLLSVDHVPVASLPWLMGAVGLGASGYVVCFAVLPESVEPHLQATVTGMVNAMAVCFAPVLQPWVGWVLDQRIDAGHLQRLDFAWALAALPISLALAVCFARFAMPRPGSNRCGDAATMVASLETHPSI